MAEHTCLRQTPPSDSGHRPRTRLPESAGADSIPTYFQQPCPACGRRLLIRVEYLGEEVRCRHCRRGFVARDGSAGHSSRPGDENAVVERADRLLATLELSARRSRRRCRV
jgi:hypothetical protein